MGSQKVVGKTTTLNVHHTFLYISLPSLHDYDLKMPNFTFCREREHKTMNLFFFSWTLIRSFTTPEKIVNIWWTERDGISPIESEAWNTSFKWHFQSRSPSCRCCLSSLLLSLKLTMHSIVRESLTELISQNVPDSTGIASVMKYILKPQRNFSYLKFLLWK